MKKTQPFLDLFSRQTHAEHFDTIEAIIAYIDPKVADIPNFATVWQHFKKAFQTEDDYFKLSQKQPGTDDVIAADKQRNESFMHLKRTVELYSYEKTENILVAVETVLDLFNRYNDAMSETYTKSSALITNFIDDLKKEPYAAAATVLKLDELIETLRQDNETFKKLYRTRAKKVYLATGDTLYVLRRNVDQAFEVVTDCLNGFYINAVMSAPTGTLTLLLEDIIDTVNSYILIAEKNLRRHVTSYRKSGTKPDKKKPDKEEDPYPEDVLRLTLSRQTIPDRYGEEGNTADMMYLYFEGDDLYLEKVYPVIRDCSILLKRKDKAVYVFRYGGDVSMGDRVPIGFGICDPKSEPIFVFPFKGFETPYPAEIRKDNKVIAIVEGVLFPELNIELTS